ncbi:MAG: 16S rRNA (guanine(966)-N(2))-methyltransferase RsmD [Desulfobulbaceae bacterium]|nr:16S rRNA (guanine(966)-N(2))-methyltransferase RsmD [Desulfobulbaceae bacterium]
MRIISGTARGRRLLTPGKTSGVSAIRPTSDRVREAVFNILGDRVKGAEVLDLFAGTGALGLEALSRGSSGAVFVDAASDAIRLIKKNLELCTFANRARVVRRDLLKGLAFLGRLKPLEGFELIFVDPPYRRGISTRIIKNLGKSALLGKNGLLIVEEGADIELPEAVAGLRMIDRRLYGDTAVYLYENLPDRDIA